MFSRRYNDCGKKEAYLQAEKLDRIHFGDAKDEYESVGYDKGQPDW